MSDEFYNEPFNNEKQDQQTEEPVKEEASGQEHEESKRVYRVNEQYVDESNTGSQYRYKFDQGADHPNTEVHQEPPKKKSSGIGKKIAGVALAAGVFIVAAGGLMLAAQKLSGTSNGNDSKDNNTVASLTHDETQAPTSDSQVEDTKGNTDETNGATTTLTKNESEIAVTGSVSASLLDVSSVVEEVMPSVVAVTNTTVYTVSSNYWSWFGSSSNSDGRTASGAGSGVIIADNGDELLIVTNAHVVNPTDYSDYGYTVDSSDITITFCNDVTVDAVVKGTNDDADLAVIAVPMDNIDEDTKAAIKIATVGDSDQLKVGNGVIAIGNALGFGQSVTVGYISAVNREVTIDNVTRELLQTDAAINPGNSGGGLFDVNGKLIGINSAKYASEDVEGIGYAIPISSSEEIITELMNQETVIREKVTDEDKAAWLGIQGDSQYTSFYDGQGAFISKVTEGGPAEQAGLMAYDIITGLNDKDITSWSGLVDELAYYEGGGTVTITYYTLQESGGRREYVERTTEVTLGFKKDMPDTTDSKED
jgi:serine protease Do